MHIWICAINSTLFWKWAGCCIQTACIHCILTPSTTMNVNFCLLSVHLKSNSQNTSRSVEIWACWFISHELWRERWGPCVSTCLHPSSFALQFVWNTFVAKISCTVIVVPIGFPISHDRRVLSEGEACVYIFYHLWRHSTAQDIVNNGAKCYIHHIQVRPKCCLVYVVMWGGTPKVMSVPLLIQCCVLPALTIGG